MWGTSERASAADVREPRGEPVETIVVTATRTAASAFDVPNAVTVVGPEDIERASSQLLPNLLQGRAGVFVQQTTPGQAIPIIRGLKGSEVLHLVDGMRLNNAIFRNSPNQYTALLDPFNVESIEVVRGPSSSLYGGDAMGGVVNVLTPEPRFDGEGWSSRADADARYASAERAVQTHVSLDAGRRDLAINGRFGFQDAGDRVAGGGETLDPTDYRSWAGSSKLVYRPDDRQDVLLDVQFLRQPKTPRYDEVVAGFGQTEPSSDVFFFEPNERLFGHARYRLALETPLFDALELHAAHQRIRDDRRARDFGDTIEQRERNASHLTGVTAQASLAQRDFAELVYGVEVYHDRVTSSRTDRDIVTGERVRARARFPDDSTMLSVAAYGQETIQIGKRLQVIVGGRYSYYDIDIAAADRGVGTNLELNDVTGNFGAAYALAGSLKLVTNLGRGFRPPNVFDLGTLGPRPGNRFNVPNADLDPETVLTWDFGLKFLDSRWRVEAIGFVSDYRDKITTVLTGDVTPDGRAVVQNRNVARVRLYGAEFDARFLQTEKLEWYATLNYTFGEEEDDGGPTEPADRIPPLNGRIGGLYRISKAWWTEALVRFATRQDRLSVRDRSDPRIDPRGTDGWATINLRGGWKPNDALRLELEIANLLDERYREHGSGVDAPGIGANLSLHLAY
ncbi:TonB-dependent receptor [Myxococcota bacterium]|nr:TonB-dependent receptor [Myxococcota bacterium]